jgi:hypothetical protein
VQLDLGEACDELIQGRHVRLVLIIFSVLLSSTAASPKLRSSRRSETRVVS